jgi:hypothetical protein
LANLRAPDEIMLQASQTAGKEPKILVFSTNNISDPGIDLAGGSHLSYSPSVMVIPVHHGYYMRLKRDSMVFSLPRMEQIVPISRIAQRGLAK